jgi:hypothetical protein
MAVPARDPHTARSPTQLELRFLDALERIHGADPLETGNLAFLSRVTVQANLPYRDPGTASFERRNGRFTLTLHAPASIGLPYGRYPRLILAWIGQEAVRTRNRELHLGDSLTAFMATLGVRASGGRHGPLRRFCDQARRLFATTISCAWSASGAAGTAEVEVGHRIATQSVVWWTSRRNDTPARGFLDGGWLLLSPEFYEELISHPVPVDYRALHALQAPLALDIYAWITWRNHSLRRPLVLSWRDLATQFGTQTRRLRNFRAEFVRALNRVRLVYPQAQVEVTSQALILRPTRTHVTPRFRSRP